jgi:hypothetical protein
MRRRVIPLDNRLSGVEDVAVFAFPFPCRAFSFAIVGAVAAGQVFVAVGQPDETASGSIPIVTPTNAFDPTVVPAIEFPGQLPPNTDIIVYTTAALPGCALVVTGYIDALPFPAFQVTANVSIPLAAAALGGGVLAGPVVSTAPVELISAPTNVAGAVKVVNANAKTIGGFIQNLDTATVLGLTTDPATAFANCPVRLNPAPAADQGGGSMPLSAFPWALAKDVYGVTSAAGPGKAGSIIFLGS